MLFAFLLLVALRLSGSSPIVEDRDSEYSILSRLSPITGAEGGWLFGIFSAGGTVSVVDRQPPITYDARPAGFGPKPDDSKLGYVIPLSSFTTPCATADTFPPILIVEEELYRGEFAADGMNNTGCPTLCVPGTRKPETSETWIALVQRGECSFVEKVLEAQRLGASGVVVGGRDDEMINMYSEVDRDDINIPSFYIQKSSYDDLMSIIKASNTTTSGLRTVSILMTVDYGAWEWYSPLLTFVLLLLLPSILTLTTLLIHRIRTARARRRERAPLNIVSQLPWRVWGGEGWEKWTQAAQPALAPTCPTPQAQAQTTDESTTDDLEGGSSQNKPPDDESDSTQGSPLPTWFRNQTECAICLSDFVNGDRVRILPCNHIFHLDEIDEWLVQRKKLCPVCKGDVTNTSGVPPDSSAPTVDAVEGETEAQSSSRSPSITRSPNPPTENTPLLPPR